MADKLDPKDQDAVQAESQLLSALHELQSMALIAYWKSVKPSCHCPNDFDPKECERCESCNFCNHDDRLCTLLSEMRLDMELAMSEEPDDTKPVDITQELSDRLVVVCIGCGRFYTSMTIEDMCPNCNKYTLYWITPECTWTLMLKTWKASYDKHRN